MRKTNTARNVIKWFKEHQFNLELLSKGVYVTNKVRLDLHCNGYNGQVNVLNSNRVIEFYSLGDGLYRAYIKL